MGIHTHTCICKTYPVVVASHVQATGLFYAFALLKVESVFVRHSTAFTLLGTARVVKANQIKRTRLFDSKPAKGLDKEVVESSKQLVDTPLLPVDDLRVELLYNEFEWITVFTANLVARGNAAPLWLERADEIANASGNSLCTETDSNETQYSKHVFIDGRLQVGQRGHNIGTTVLVAPAQENKRQAVSILVAS